MRDLLSLYTVVVLPVYMWDRPSCIDVGSIFLYTSAHNSLQYALESILLVYGGPYFCIRDGSLFLYKCGV
jgi:hypothetical protein